MTKQIITEYVKKVKLLMPLHGQEEKLYIRKLKEHMEEYLDAAPDAKIEDLYREFGSPMETAADYLRISDERYLMRKLNISRIIKRFIAFCAAIVFCLAIWFGTLLYNIYQKAQNSHIATEQTILIVGDEEEWSEWE